MKYSQALNQALQSISNENRWCLWRLEQQGEKVKKVPINAQTGGGAMVNAPTTWTDFDTAYTARNELKCNGYGFFLGGGYAGIDIDDCIDSNGKLSDMAEKIIKAMDSYTEKSPSGRGIHILCKVSEGFTLDSKKGTRNDSIGLELYCDSHYLTITGHVYGNEKPIEFRDKELLTVYREYFVAQRGDTAKKQAVNSLQGQNSSRLTGSESDNELWGRMFDSQKGASIRALYNGDISGHDNDDSRADLALCAYLAYWTGHDAWRMDRMFRQSGLYRPKWDERHGTQTYGAITIDKAISTTPEYTPPEYTQEQQAEKEVDEILAGDDWKYKPETDNTMLGYLENSFYSDIERVKKYRTRKTGYSNIDKYNSLYPGLYVVGSVTGNGKTTFCLQMAEYLASVGEHVLFFSLEQTKLELATKGLARLTAQEVLKKYGNDALTKYTNTDAVSAIEIRGGKITPIVKQAIETYKTYAENLNVFECSFATSVEEIIDTVNAYVSKHEVKPVIFVDYLQIVEPAKSNKNMAKRDSVDDTVKRFKNLSKENELAVFLISSLNRQNYLSVVDFESFKESGGIEYTADEIWGLQLLCMNATIFNTDKDLQTKRKFVHDAKNATPRKIELAGLKNRNGRSNTRYFFDYYAEYDLFIPYEREPLEVDTEMENAYKTFKARYESEEMTRKPKKTA